MRRAAGEVRGQRGNQLLRPGQIVFCVLAEVATDEPGRQMAASIGLALPADGVVTGFGSLIVDGVRRNDGNATYSTEAQQGAAVSMPMTGAMLGHSMEFAYDASGNITSAMMSPEIVNTSARRLATA